MFIYAEISQEIAATHNGTSAHFVVYVPPGASADYNVASLCIWMVPGTEAQD